MSTGPTILRTTDALWPDGARGVSLAADADGGKGKGPVQAIRPVGKEPADRTPPPVVAAGIATVVSVGLVALAMFKSGRPAGWFLLWNLFLAWVPLLFATLAARPGNRRQARWVWGTLWLLFWPNAPYIFTDLVHVGPREAPEFWPELGVVLLFSLTGLVVGYLSLHRMQRLVTRHYGLWIGWGVVVFCCLLGSAGVAIGRFLRWNSWDALIQPVGLILGIVEWLAGLRTDPHTFAFLGLFTVFLFLGYLMFHSMGRLTNEPPER